MLAGNVRARRFYEAGGWRTDGTERAERVFGVPVVEARYRKTLIAPSGTSRGSRPP